MDNKKMVVWICLLACSIYAAWPKEELKPVQVEPKYPQIGIIEKECLKTGIYCPVLADGIFDNR